METGLEKMVCQYEQTAVTLKSRISELKLQRKTVLITGPLDERIALLSAQRRDLILIARHLRTTYLTKEDTNA